ncbi:fused chemotaxis regulator; protein-glutamate methylesterase in two-component regulatory system with CheA [Candidatus Filomicrobium marinum]|uniref:Protein-glutamate methylesterase/protein-glutamine glutaminase n=1 Tax=Candidatus Filomicrobium marinum TaxID=1608628 RepID=A0A0D6JJ28_9HYPH|nr:chemotaxis response regulator protein-glutamate methylesterase [Candidatus Filomicrobium marinum]CFX33283.1 fused chemotaxis regulator; protein-glutamate methylesterase in two-component regulatory system with CheA [Candidatus Filomicrobium marinum]CPR21926.1 fused chemotaxis regulator; protein-glutamate methylesterase in two-component regulatory system with CheA [Candidatus Filomicrobium marinum]
MLDRLAKSASSEKIRVLIVDDSATVRRALSDIISSAPDLEVMATASDPYKAAERMRDEIPDVMFLDIEMPRMDGLTFLRRIMAQRPIPVVICSTLTAEGSTAFMQALEAGAVDVITKPRVDTAQALSDSRMRICDVARAAAHARIGVRRRVVQPVKIEKKLTADAIIPHVTLRKRPGLITDRIIAIGASTGGTEALRAVLTALPVDCPGIVIVQHMPERFTASFAERLDGLCRIAVKEAETGDPVIPGRALIAPGNHHMLLERLGKQYRVVIKDGPHVSRHRPSVDVLFRSAAQAAGANAMGILLTGMGDDGAHGLLEMRSAGARTVAQDEATCVVFGMPKEAIALGAAEKILPLDRIARQITEDVRRSPEACAS